MDQGVIHDLKHKYGKHLQVTAAEDPIPLITFLKAVDLKMAVNFAASAWAKVKTTTVKNCFIKGLGPVITKEQDEDDEFDFEGFTTTEVDQATLKLQEISKENDQLLLSVHDGLQTSHELTEEELRSQAVSSSTAQNYSSDDEDAETTPLPPPEKMSAVKAHQGMEWALQYFEEVPGTDNMYILHPAKEMIAVLKKERVHKMKQKTVLEMFSKNQ
ncbi:Uncharacterized protein FKW44_006249 [Caligus rogercresseyi]|uniref:DDE-1 domain-containing protein n=1 Tax=Caligus rogercresseyi TaxID=217165 RepID=A0A7T8QSR5_CALRO|nr:Uncharacterized protein FKW44_006249 [Caligus rogercresseyi]